MGQLISWEEFGELFRRYEYTTFRLETRDTYVVADEQERFHRWLDGRYVGPDTEDHQWYRDIRAAVSHGKRFERVRVVTEPHTDYTRWLLAVSNKNVAAGEDIRYLPRSQADALGLPYEDYWLFDSRYAVEFHFDADGVIYERELVDDPEVTVRRNHWRDIAWHHAIPWKEYAASFAK